MTIQQIVSPEKIETELLKIWEDLSKENTTRASLFNLIVFNRLSSRTDYIRNIVYKVAEKFPCRTLFISEESPVATAYLKTAISVLFSSDETNPIACDLIDIGVAGSDIEKVPSLLLPHLLTDLPIYLLWTEDPSPPHPLFAPLSALAHRIIFDSESADLLLNFATTLLKLQKKTKADIADLNWARIQGWKDLIDSVFNPIEKVSELGEIAGIRIVYNGRESEFFCHLKIQAMYLLAWLASRLEWTVKKANQNLQFSFGSQKGNIESSIVSEHWEKLGSGTVIGIEITTRNGNRVKAFRIRERYHYVKIETSSSDSCELPYEFLLGQTATGQSLVREICMKGTSSHYLEMLKTLLILDKDKLC